MSYDKNSPEARKGALGEAIVKEILESWGAVVTRPDEHGEKALIDFLAVPDENQKFAARYVEVKVRSALPYAYGQYPCYTFPVVQIEAYKKYMAENNLPVERWLVAPEKAEILLGTLDERSPVCIENITAPNLAVTLKSATMTLRNCARLTAANRPSARRIIKSKFNCKSKKLQLPIKLCRSKSKIP
ncbi:MAG: hypothetical protein IJP68_01575 [Selenomonadaceae bacterium]|nr:hypothetical protein [Selenomonadaceae bacterium]